MTPNDPLARRAQYLLPRESLADLRIFDAGNRASLPVRLPAAASADVPLAAARRRAAVGDQSGRAHFEFRYLAHALLDIGAALFGLFFIALYLGCIALAVFILLVAIQ